MRDKTLMLLAMLMLPGVGEAEGQRDRAEPAARASASQPAETLEERIAKLRERMRTAPPDLQPQLEVELRRLEALQTHK